MQNNWPEPTSLGSEYSQAPGFTTYTKRNCFLHLSDCNLSQQYGELSLLVHKPILRHDRAPRERTTFCLQPHIMASFGRTRAFQGVQLICLTLVACLTLESSQFVVQTTNRLIVLVSLVSHSSSKATAATAAASVLLAHPLGTCAL